MKNAPKRASIRRGSLVLYCVLLIAAGALSSDAALACSVCSGSDAEEVRSAFILTTAFLTFFPLLMIGGVLYWLHRRYRDPEPVDLSRSDASR